MAEQNIMSYDAFSFVRATTHKYIIKDENRKIQVKITYNKKVEHCRINQFMGNVFKIIYLCRNTDYWADDTLGN